MMGWLDWAWRLSVAVLVRAPVMLLFLGLSKATLLFEILGDHIPGLPYYPPWEK